jgi:hypothetical protein
MRGGSVYNVCAYIYVAYMCMFLCNTAYIKIHVGIYMGIRFIYYIQY